jgi:hypothetical protein
MAKNEKTSERVASIAAKALRAPGKPTEAEIETLAGSVLTQAPDKKPTKSKPKAKPSRRRP